MARAAAIDPSSTTDTSTISTTATCTRCTAITSMNARSQWMQATQRPARQAIVALDTQLATFTTQTAVTMQSRMAITWTTSSMDTFITSMTVIATITAFSPDLDPREARV
jgi:hypothetical protein